MAQAKESQGGDRTRGRGAFGRDNLRQPSLAGPPWRCVLHAERHRSFYCSVARQISDGLLDDQADSVQGMNEGLTCASCIVGSDEQATRTRHRRKQTHQAPGTHASAQPSRSRVDQLAAERCPFRRCRSSGVLHRSDRSEVGASKRLSIFLYEPDKVG
jgi:hypothetical protein